jgi:hypothetical protein
LFASEARIPISRCLLAGYLEPFATVYANFGGCFGSFEANARAMLPVLDQSETRRLILELRTNPGGNFLRARRLIDELKKRSKFLKRGSVYVLTRRRTASAAVVNAMDLRRDLGAILVGEPTGEQPNTYGEARTFTLPNSKLIVRYSRTYYTFQERGEPAVFPDKRFDPAWTDCKVGRDVPLEWVLAQPLPE